MERDGHEKRDKNEKRDGNEKREREIERERAPRELISEIQIQTGPREN